MIQASTRVIAVVVALVGCNPMREMQYTRALERSLQLAYPESAVSAKLSGRHVLMLTFDPLPKSVATSSNKAEALRRLAKTALDSFAHGEEVDSVEVSEVRLGMRIRGTGLTAESTIQFPVSELNDGVAKGASK